MRRRENHLSSPRNHTFRFCLAAGRPMVVFDATRNHIAIMPVGLVIVIGPQCSLFRFDQDGAFHQPVDEGMDRPPDIDERLFQLDQRLRTARWPFPLPSPGQYAAYRPFSLSVLRLSKQTFSQDCQNDADAVMRANFFALFISTPMIADGHFVIGLAVRNSNGQDFGMLIPTHRLSEHGSTRSRAIHQIATVDIGEGRIVDNIKMKVSTRLPNLCQK